MNNREEDRARREYARHERQRVQDTTRRIRRAVGFGAAGILAVTSMVINRHSNQAGSPPDAGNTTSFSLNQLTDNDREVLDWYIPQLRKADKQGEYSRFDDKILCSLLSADPQTMKMMRTMYDMAMEAEAELKSGRDMTIPDSPRVPLKWDALTPFQKKAVDFAIERSEKCEVDKLSEETLAHKRSQKLEQPENLQSMIDKFRESQQRKPLAGPAR